jgi:hypothetical protein
LRYVRYADDFLWDLPAKSRSRGDQGSVAGVLYDSLQLELSPEKTLITHATTGAAGS